MSHLQNTSTGVGGPIGEKTFQRRMQERRGSQQGHGTARVAWVKGGVARQISREQGGCGERNWSKPGAWAGGRREQPRHWQSFRLLSFRVDVFFAPHLNPHLLLFRFCPRSRWCVAHTFGACTPKADEDRPSVFDHRVPGPATALAPHSSHPSLIVSP